MSFLFFSLKVRAFLWLTQALIKRYRTSLFFGFSIGLFLFISLGFAYPFVRSNWLGSKAKRIALVGKYSSTDFPLLIQNQMSFGLTRLTPAGEATPAAATRWEVEEEGRLYKFELDQKLVWQDGKPFTAQDVNYNLKDAEASVLNDHAIQIKLKEPFSPFPALLSQPLFKKGLVGLGQYKIRSLKIVKEHLQNLVIEPVDRSNPLQIIDYKFYPNEEMAVLAYKLGEIDRIEDVTDLTPFDKWPVKVEEETTRDRYVGLFYNTEDAFLAEKNIRQALTYAVPIESGWERAYSPLSPDSWAYNDKIKKYESDLAFGRKLLSKNNGRIVLSTILAYKELAERVKQAWMDIGLEVELKIEPKVPETFQVLLAAQEIPQDPDQYSLWHSTQEKTNITHYKSPRIDKLLEDGRKLIDKEERLKKYLDFQKYLADEIPVAFLYYPKRYTITRP